MKISMPRAPCEFGNLESIMAGSTVSVWFYEFVGSHRIMSWNATFAGGVWRVWFARGVVIVGAAGAKNAPYYALYLIKRYQEFCPV